ncbi:MAG: hypothetical protein MJ091_06275, partial [Clostridia bacterium]|nr:hypothetical protein [Clostridia bacterium]
CLIFITGLCAAGLPILYVCELIYGIVASVIIGALYYKYGINGLGFSSLVIIPVFSSAAAVNIRASCTSGKMSVNILSALLGNNTFASGNNLNKYIKDFIIKIIPLPAAAVLSAGAFKLLGGLFDFIG